MRPPVLLLLLITLVGCTADKPVPHAVISAQLNRAAAASVYAAREVNATTPDTQQRQVIDSELTLALTYMPPPTQAEINEALKRTNKALQADLIELHAIYLAASNEAAAARAEAAAAAAREAESIRRQQQRDKALYDLLNKAWWFVGVLAVASIIAAFTRNFRLAFIIASTAALISAGVVSILLLPQWFPQILGIVLLTFSVMAPACAWWTYRVGLFQSPNEDESNTTK